MKKKYEKKIVGPDIPRLFLKIEQLPKAEHRQWSNPNRQKKRDTSKLIHHKGGRA